MRAPAARLALLLLLLAASLPASATWYQRDNGVVDSSSYNIEAEYAVMYQFDDEPGLILRTLTIRQAVYDAGSMDVYLWAYDNATGKPGAVLGHIDAVNIPVGSGWVSVDLRSLAIAVAPAGKIFVGVKNCTTDVNWDTSPTNLYSYYRLTGTGWARYPTDGELMVRLETGSAYNPVPTRPDVTITPAEPCYGDTLVANASGSTTDYVGGEIAYIYHWSKSTDGVNWSPWSWRGKYLSAAWTQPDEYWRVRARARVATYASPWRISEPVQLRKLIVSHTPVAGATGTLRRAPVNITVRWPVVPNTFQARFSLTAAGSTEKIFGKFRWSDGNRQVQLTPMLPLAPNTLYTAMIKPGIKRADGGSLHKMESFTFTTGDQPVVTSFTPKGTILGYKPTIRAYFDRDIKPGSVTSSTFVVRPMFEGSKPVAGTLTVTGNLISFVPSPALRANMEHKVFLMGGIRGMDDRQLGLTFAWSFFTPALSAPAALSVTASAATAGAGNTAITVNLAVEAEVQAVITNIAGRTIAVLPARVMSQGVNTLLWDGRATSGTKVPPGMYLTQITAKSESGATARCQTLFRR